MIAATSPAARSASSFTTTWSNSSRSPSSHWPSTVVGRARPPSRFLGRATAARAPRCRGGSSRTSTASGTTSRTCRAPWTSSSSRTSPPSAIVARTGPAGSPSDVRRSRPTRAARPIPPSGRTRLRRRTGSRCRRARTSAAPASSPRRRRRDPATGVARGRRPCPCRPRRDRRGRRAFRGPGRYFFANSASNDSRCFAPNPRTRRLAEMSRRSMILRARTFPTPGSASRTPTPSSSRPCRRPDGSARRTGSRYRSSTAP